jgi:hypothetical protein
MKIILDTVPRAADKWVKPPIQIPGTQVYKIVACWLLRGDRPDKDTRWQTQGYHVGEEAAWKAFAKESCWFMPRFRFLNAVCGPLSFVRRDPRHNPPE